MQPQQAMQMNQGQHYRSMHPPARSQAPSPEAEQQSLMEQLFAGEVKKLGGDQLEREAQARREAEEAQRVAQQQAAREMLEKRRAEQIAARRAIDEKRSAMEKQRA